MQSALPSCPHKRPFRQLNGDGVLSADEVTHMVEQIGFKVSYDLPSHLAVGETVIFLTPPLHPLLTHLLKGEGGAAE